MSPDLSLGHLFGEAAQTQLLAVIGGNGYVIFSPAGTFAVALKSAHNYFLEV